MAGDDDGRRNFYLQRGGFPAPGYDDAPLSFAYMPRGCLRPGAPAFPNTNGRLAATRDSTDVSTALVSLADRGGDGSHPLLFMKPQGLRRGVIREAVPCTWVSLSVSVYGFVQARGESRSLLEWDICKQGIISSCCRPRVSIYK